MQRVCSVTMDGLLNLTKQTTHDKGRTVTIFTAFFQQHSQRECAGNSNKHDLQRAPCTRSVPTQNI